MNRLDVWFYLFVFVMGWTQPLAAQSKLQLERDTNRGPFICTYYTEAARIKKNFNDTSSFVSPQWFNFLQQEGQEFISIGSLGSSAYHINNISWFQSGFVLRRNTHDAYDFKMNQIKYYTPNKPFVDLMFNFGANNTVITQVEHGQMMSKHTSVGFMYRRIASAGAYVNNNSLINNTSLYFRWSTPNYRFYQTISFMLNDTRNLENGGLQYNNPSDIFLFNKSFLTTKINTANNVHYNTNWSLDHVYILKRYNRDTLNQYVYDNDFARVQVYYKNELNRFLDNPADSAFYMGLAQKGQKIESKFYENKIGVRGELNVGIIRNKLQFNPYVDIEHIKVVSGTNDSLTYNAGNIFIGGMLHVKKLTNNIIEVIDFNKGTAGYNIADLMLGASGHWRISEKIGSLRYRIQLARKNQNYVQNNLNTSILNYNNDFPAMNSAIGVLQYAIGKKWRHKFTAAYEVRGNYVYLDSSMQYRLQSSYFYLMSLGYAMQWQAKHFGTKIDVMYQANGSSNIPSIPFWGKGSVYYQGQFFKKNLKFQLGTDIRYTSSFALPGYHPLLSDFYTQQTIFSKPMPIADFFINAQIKTVFITIKYNDLLEGLNNQVNFNAVRYAVQGRGMDILIKWRFLN